VAIEMFSFKIYQVNVRISELLYGHLACAVGTLWPKNQ